MIFNFLIPCTLFIMYGQIKINYAHVTVANTPIGDEVVIHLDAKWLAKTKVSILCSSHPCKNGNSNSKMIELDLYTLLGFLKPVVDDISTENTKTKQSKPSSKKKVFLKGKKK